MKSLRLFRGLRLPVALCGVLALCAVAAPAGATLRAARAPALEKGITDDPLRYGSTFFPRLKSLRATFVVYGVSWAAVAPSQPADPTDPLDPAYDWTKLDTVYREATSHGIAVVPDVAQAPGWANGDRASNHPPTDPQQFADFLVAMAKRYPRIAKWIIWGEPSRAASWSEQGCEGARRYAVLLDDAYAALKRVEPRSVVIGGNNQPAGFNNAGSTSPLRWLACMKLPSARRPRLDMWGLSTYTQRPIDLALPPQNRWSVDFDDLDTFAVALDRTFRHRHLKFFIFESGTPTGHANHDWLWFTTPADQALRTRQTFAALAGFSRVTAISNYLLEDERGANGWTTGLVTSKGAKKPAWAAFRAGA